MNSIKTPDITAVLNSIRRMSVEDLALVIEAANYELAQAIDEEQAMNDYDEMLARQYAYDLLHGRTNALEGIK